jgi:glycosyltransferase involved in cell wall biosynthesis
MNAEHDIVPTVSVVIAVLNGERLIAEAIESALAQTLVPHEIIVVDDGSTDETAEVVMRYPSVRLIRQANAGPAAARNAAIRVASGEYIAPLDHDDLFTPDRLRVMVKALEAHPEAPYVAGKQRIEVLPGTPLPDWLKSTDPSELERLQVERGTDLILMRRSAFDHVGFFDESMTSGGEDVDWVFRCAELGLVEVEVHDEVLIRRLHGRNMTMDEDGMKRAMFAILRKRAQRRRGS